MKTLAFLGLTALYINCSNPDDERVFRDRDNLEEKPTASGLDSKTKRQAFQGTLNQNSGTGKVEQIGTVTYHIKISTTSEAVLCRGEATVNINSDFSMKFPTANLRCGSLVIDLSKILSQDAIGQTSGAKPSLSHDGKVLAIDRMGQTSFDPPRPLILGPIFQDIEKFVGFAKTTSHQIKGTDASTGKPFSDSGSFTVKVIEVDGTYTNKHLSEGFDRILQWQVSSSGFERTPSPSVNGMIFKNMEFFWNVDPIMIPKVVIKGNMKDLIASTDQSNLDVVGEVVFELIVKNYQL